MRVNSIPPQVKSAMYQLSQEIRQGNSLHESANFYHKLIYTLIDNILQSCYPRVFTMLHLELKEKLLKKFFSQYPCTQPAHHQLPDEFIRFLQAEHLPVILNKVAEVEWLELCVELCDKPSIKNKSWDDKFLNCKLSISPAAVLLNLPFNFDEITMHYIPLLENSVYYRLIYQHNYAVKNIAITQFMARLIQLFQIHSTHTVKELISIFEKESHHKIEPQKTQTAIIWLYQHQILLLT